MELTVTKRRTRLIWLKLVAKMMKTMSRRQKQLKMVWKKKPRVEKMLNHWNSVKDLVSSLHWNKPSNIKRNMLHQMIFLTMNCQSSSIGVMSMAMISLVKLETKVLVAHATQLHSLKQWSLDWNWNMDKKHHNCHLSFYLIAITWLKDVKVVGLISMLTLLRMDISLAKTVHHTSTPPKVPNVLSTNNAHLLPK